MVYLSLARARDEALRQMLVDAVRSGKHWGAVTQAYPAQQPPNHFTAIHAPLRMFIVLTEDLQPQIPFPGLALVVLPPLRFLNVSGYYHSYPLLIKDCLLT